MATKNNKLEAAQKRKTTNNMTETNSKRYDSKTIEGGNLNRYNPLKIGMRETAQHLHIHKVLNYVSFFFQNWGTDI